MKENIVDVFNAWLDSHLERIHTAIPGKIESYSGHSDRKAKVKPLIKLKTSQGASLTIPPIENVPVIFPSSNTFNLLYPLKKGDNCLIVFSEVGIGNYLNGKGVNDVEPDDLSRFSLTDAICIPGLWPFSSTPSSVKATIEVDDSGNVSVDGGDIKLNGESKRFVTYSELNTALQTFKTDVLAAINSHVHSGVTTGPGTSGVATPPKTLSIDISASETQTIKTGG